MLAGHSERILGRLGDDDLVLDVGGGANPFPRADWVIDLMPYADRGRYGPALDADAERFSAATWIQRDICDREPWPFADDQFEFSVCSHTLEDVRDPIFVCAELIRVSKAGYVEVPSRLEEQSFGFQGPWAGWGHHRWLIDITGDEITFVFKHHVLHGRASDQFGPGFRDSLTPERRVSWLWWTGHFDYRELIFLEAGSLDAYLAEYVSSQSPGRPGPPAGTERRRRLRDRRHSR